MCVWGGGGGGGGSVTAEMLTRCGVGKVRKCVFGWGGGGGRECHS